MGRNAAPWPKGGDGWWYVAIDGKQRKLPVKGPKNKENTDKALKAMYKLKAESEDAAQKRATLAIGLVMDVYLKSIEKTHELDTRLWKERNVTGFVKHVGKDFPTTEIKPFHVTSWMDKTDWENGTKAAVIRVIKRMFNWAIEQGYIEVNPIARMKAPTVSPTECVLTGEQADAILANVPPGVFHDLLVALRETGCRPKEIWTLTADRVNLESGTWKVIDKIRKKTGYEFRTVYLTAEMIELSRRLAGQHPEGPIFLNAYGRPWRRSTIGFRFRRLRPVLTKATKKAYGDECIAYAYRHLWVTDALERGIPPATVAELVGHSDMKMIMKVYSHLKHRTDHLREAAENARRNTSPAAHQDRSGDNPREHGQA